GKGRIIAFDKVPLLNHVRQAFPTIIGDKGKGLVAEGNYYYDLNTNYISWHGDGERRKVIAIRTGATFPLYYRWFYQSKPIGVRGDITLGHGDIYIMSEKAVASDWKKKNILTLRHAAAIPGSKHLIIKEKKKKSNI